MVEGESRVRTIIGEAELKQRVHELATEIRAAYKDRDPVLIGILKGCYVFMADLSRALAIPHEVDFLAVASYGKSTRAGAFRLLKDLSAEIEGRHVLIVEDICDTGASLRAVRDIIRQRHPASVAICVLIDKPVRRVVDLAPEYVGFAIGDEFVVGYGLDYAEHYRHLPYIAALDATDIHPDGPEAEDSPADGELSNHKDHGC
jgi:hypoxanthine phosphoribosyltransferase